MFLFKRYFDELKRAYIKKKLNFLPNVIIHANY